MAKILILTGDAAESLEVMYPYQRLLEEGYEVHIAAPSRKKLQFVVHDFVEGFDTYTEKPGYTWAADLAFDEVEPADYVALVIPGGQAPEYIRNNDDCRRIVQYFYFFTADKPVAQLCPRAVGADRGRSAGGPADGGLPGAGTGRSGGRRRVRRPRRSGRSGGRRDGVGAGLAGPPRVDARVHPDPASQVTDHVSQRLRSLRARSLA